MYAFEWRALRYDIGNRLDYVECLFDYALGREDMGDELSAYLRRIPA